MGLARNELMTPSVKRAGLLRGSNGVLSAEPSCREQD
jgi:hypothetical protein